MEAVLQNITPILLIISFKSINFTHSLTTDSFTKKHIVFVAPNSIHRLVFLMEGRFTVFDAILNQLANILYYSIL